MLVFLHVFLAQIIYHFDTIQWCPWVCTDSTILGSCFNWMWYLFILNRTPWNSTSQFLNQLKDTCLQMYVFVRSFFEDIDPYFFSPYELYKLYCDRVIKLWPLHEFCMFTMIIYSKNIYFKYINAIESCSLSFSPESNFLSGH